MSASRRPRRSRFLLRSGVFLGLMLALSGCSTKDMPAYGMPDPITLQGHRVISLWKGSWVAAWAVGIFVWGLMIYCIIRFRKRSEELPPQVHYNIPIEILYTVVPFVMITVLFWFTAVDEDYLDKLKPNPDVTVNVIGYQWAWQFDYETGPAQGLQIHGRPGDVAQLVLPVGERVRFKLTSPDVVHAFWVPDFLFKRDVVPGRVNQFEVTLEREGTFRGFCTELCGVDHDRMLFSLRVVKPDEFATFASTALTAAKAGNVTDRYTYTDNPSTAPTETGTGTEPNQSETPGED